ncbi:hypothetical protein [Sporichthya polymorpha]|uniref:hypothetical protein n=1 Tax=Sporichthya polymorpha TaxID=35751 RepID=UPI00036DF71A|nr:hypothetical protein [Sporichthya polymorpha]
MSLSIRSSRAGALLVSAAVCGAPLVLSGPAAAVDAPGNNGTIKVHAPDTPFERRANEPRQVCSFYLAGFNFDSNQVVDYRFSLPPGGPNGGEPRGNPGSFTVGPDNGRPAGDGRTPVLDPDEHGLENGRYRVTATTDDGSKTKVFRIACDDDGEVVTPTPTPGGGSGGDDGDDGGVGGVGTPQDDGEPGVGGVATGGGGLSGTSAGADVAFPLTVLALGGLAVGTLTLHRRRAG